MKSLLILLLMLSFLGCKEECFNCETYKLTNIKQVQKKCDGLPYDLSDFEEIHIGADAGLACGKDEINSMESDVKNKTFTLCEGVRYTEKLFVRCNK